MRRTSDLVRGLVTMRAKGRCERCGLASASLDMSHRVARGMGGGKVRQDDPVLYNALCRKCHRWVEAHPFLAYQGGWKVRRGEEPADVPVDRWSGLVYLTAGGGVASERCSDGSGPVTPPEDPLGS